MLAAALICGSTVENTMETIVFSATEPSLQHSCQLISNIFDAHTVLEGTAIGSFIDQLTAEKKAPSCQASLL